MIWIDLLIYPANLKVLNCLLLRFQRITTLKISTFCILNANFRIRSTIIYYSIISYGEIGDFGGDFLLVKWDSQQT